MKTDFLVIGSGIAGLSFAIKAAELGEVVIVTKKQAADSNTNRAQGGIASVIDPTDDIASHVRDTCEAGRGLCDEAMVELMVSRGPASIKEMRDWGVAFSEKDGKLSLGREGGHTNRRIVHVADYTGQAMEETLLNRVRSHPNITLLENHLAINLALSRHLRKRGLENRVYGAYVLNEKQDQVLAIAARWTVLATGGCGKVYAYTSNPDIATGDGVAMAYRAGAKITNMEFVQFHPTCLYHPQLRTQLISEAVRGEGAILVNDAGENFMSKYDPRAELAPRDVVARAIDQEIKIRGDKKVFLDFKPIGSERIPERFPAIFSALRNVGIDARKDLVPVVPAAHYFCGGVVVDAYGRTDLDHLLAIGEVACTGAHGANRLASNSLLEAVVFTELALQHIIDVFDSRERAPELKKWSANESWEYRETVVLDHDWDLVRRIMMDYVGIVRTDERLLLADARIRMIRKSVEDFYWKYQICAELIELRNIALVSQLIIRSALSRKESRGLHFNLDYPDTDPNLATPTILQRGRRYG
ncbi:MAG: L-aspartate oxidase [bacterium]|nr:L-aspartate oxidase [bacterium]